MKAVNSIDLIKIAKSFWNLSIALIIFIMTVHSTNLYSASFYSDEISDSDDDMELLFDADIKLMFDADNPLIISPNISIDTSNMMGVYNASKSSAIIYPFHISDSNALSNYSYDFYNIIEVTSDNTIVPPTYLYLGSLTESNQLIKLFGKLSLKSPGITKTVANILNTLRNEL